MVFNKSEAIIVLTEIGGQAFCEGCIYSDGESCMKIVPPEVELDQDGEIEFCSGLTY